MVKNNQNSYFCLKSKTTFMTDNYALADTSKEIFQELLNGNVRFVIDSMINNDYRTQLFNNINKESIKVIIITDISPELAVEPCFDRKLGELVVYRVPGGRITPVVLESIEDVLKNRNIKLIVNLGIDNSTSVKNKSSLSHLKSIKDNNPIEDIFDLNTTELSRFGIDIKNAIYRSGTGMIERQDF
jgi:carbonic anhydrase